MAEVLPATGSKRRLGAQARAWCLVAAALSALPLLRLVPPWLALSLAALGLGAAWASARRPVPAWVLVPVTLGAGSLVLVAHGFQFGRDTGSALLLTMLALKIAESSRQRDGRALVGFALFATFAALIQDQGPLTLLLALPAVAAMLVASGRLAEEEASVPTPLGLRSRIRGVAMGMLIALPLALAGFWLFPRLAAPLWGVPENAIASPGISGEMSPGDWLDIMTDESVAFRARFLGETPPRQSLYWRGPVLWDFDGRTWTRPAWTTTLPEPAVVPADGGYSYELTLEPTERSFLFALDLPTAAPPGERLDGDLTPMARRPVNSLLRYQLDSVTASSFEAELPARVRELATRLPAQFNPRIRQEVGNWVDEGLEPRAIVQRSLDWFNRDFSYSLAAPPLGRHSVDEFMFDTRVGFCEHFSSAFVFMMREAGIPARVVTGYVGGYLNPMGEHWRIQQSDAHAWAEVWLDGPGWVRVDPTAAVDPSRVFERYGAAGPGGSGSSMRSYDGPLRDIADFLRRNWNEVVLGFDADSQRLMLTRLGIDDPREWQVGVAFALGAAAALAFTLWMLLRERGNPRDPLLAAYRCFNRRLARAGVTRLAHEPELAFARRAASALPGSAEAIATLSQRFSDARYSSEVDHSADAALIEDLRAFRPASRTGAKR